MNLKSSHVAGFLNPIDRRNPEEPPRHSRVTTASSAASPRPMSVFPAPLALARATFLLAAPAVAAVTEVVALVSDFLDVSATIRPPRAAASGSRILFDRVAAPTVAATQLDPSWRSHWFCLAMEIALTNDDLAIAQMIHAVHPEPLAVRSLEVALRHATLETVQWVVENRHDQLCCRPGLAILCHRCLDFRIRSLGKSDALRIVKWLSTDLGPLVLVDMYGGLYDQYAALALESAELLEWFDANGWLSNAQRETYLFDFLEGDGSDVSDVDVVRYLVGQEIAAECENCAETAHALSRYSCNPQLQEVIEIVIASHLCDALRGKFVYAPTRSGGAKVLQWDAKILKDRRVARTLGVHALMNGHLDTMRWLVEERGVTLDGNTGLKRMHGSEQDCIDMLAWRIEHGCLNAHAALTTLTLAAKQGSLEIIKVLHPIFTPVSTKLIDEAAAYGHLHVVTWLYENSTDRSTPQALCRAAENGYLHVVQWLQSVGCEGSRLEAMARAAQAGQLEVLAWLYNDVSAMSCPHCVFRETRFNAPQLLAWGLELPVLHCLQWLDSKRHAWVGGPCERCAQPQATIKWDLFGACGETGDLALMKHLHRDVLVAPRDDQWISDMICLVAHPGVLEWVHRELSTTLDWTMIRRAAKRCCCEGDVLELMDRLEQSDSQGSENTTSTTTSS